MDLYLKLILLFISSILYFLSIAGYGKYITSQNSNYFETYFNGTILILILSYIIYLTIGTNLIINVIVIITGLILYFLSKKKFKIIKKINFFLLFSSLFSILLISKTHEDFNNYHYFSIYEVFHHNLRIGISNLNSYFIHSSLLKFNQSLLVLPYFDFKLIHLPIFLIYFSTLGYFIIILFKKKINDNEIFYSLLCIFVLLIKFNRLSEFGYDYISQFLLLIVFHKIYFLKNDKEEIAKAILYFILSILIKPISLLFSPILFFIFYSNGFNFYKKIYISKYLFSILLFLILFSSSFLKTGCVFYPINSTCFSKEKIFWSEKNYLKSYSSTIELWSKSYDSHKKKSKYNKIEDKKVYLENFNWVKFWIENHFFYKIFEFLLIILFLVFLLYFLFSKSNIQLNKSNIQLNKDKKNKQIILLLSSLSILFWFFTVPQFRFIFSSIIIFIFLLINLSINVDIKFDKQKFIYLFVIALLFLNTKNVIRIKKEFLRNDFYKFTNFPFYNNKIVEYDYSNIKRYNFFHIEFLK